MRTHVTAALLAGSAAIVLAGCTTSGHGVHSTASASGSTSASPVNSAAAASSASASRTAAVHTWASSLTPQVTAAFAFVDQMRLSTSETHAQDVAEATSCASSAAALKTIAAAPAGVDAAALKTVHDGVQSLYSYCSEYHAGRLIYQGAYPSTRKKINTYLVHKKSFYYKGNLRTCSNPAGCVTPDKSKWPALAKLEEYAYITVPERELALLKKTGAPFPTWATIWSKRIADVQSGITNERPRARALTKKNGDALDVAAKKIRTDEKKTAAALDAAFKKVYGAHVDAVLKKAKSDALDYYGHQELAKLRTSVNGALAQIH